MAWLKKNGLTPKIGENGAAEVEVAPGYNQTRFENIYKLPEGKKRKDIVIGLRSDKASSSRTPDGIYTVDIGHPSGNGKFKFVQIGK